MSFASYQFTVSQIQICPLWWSFTLELDCANPAPWSPARRLGFVEEGTGLTLDTRARPPPGFQFPFCFFIQHRSQVPVALNLPALQADLRPHFQTMNSPPRSHYCGSYGCGLKSHFAHPAMQFCRSASTTFRKLSHHPVASSVVALPIPRQAGPTGQLQNASLPCNSELLRRGSSAQTIWEVCSSSRLCVLEAAITFSEEI